MSPMLVHGEPLTLEQAKANHIRLVLAALGWNVAVAAQVLAIERRTLYRMLKRYGIERGPLAAG